MTCQGISCAQGRQPCTTPHACGLKPLPRSCASLGVCQGRTPPCAGCSQPDLHSQTAATALHQANSDGTHRDDATSAHTDTSPTPLPWDWVDDLKDFALIAPIAATLVCVAAISLGALVGWVLKG